MHPHPHDSLFSDASSAGAAPVYSCASLTCFGMAAKNWAIFGLDWSTLALLLGGCGTFLMAGVNVSRECRVWLDRREKGRSQTPRLHPGNVPDSSGPPSSHRPR